MYILIDEWSNKFSIEQLDQSHIDALNDGSLDIINATALLQAVATIDNIIQWEPILPA